MPTFPRQLLARLSVTKTGLGSTTSAPAGSGTLYYTVTDTAGAVLVARTNAGITEIATGSYAASASNWDTAWAGLITWSTGTAPGTVEAIEDFGPAQLTTPLSSAQTTTATQTGLTNQGYTIGRAPGLDNLDVAVSSRLAGNAYTAPPTVAQNRQEMDANSTKLANLDATVSSRSTFAGGAVASVTGAVGSVTGNVGGNVAGSVGSVTNAVSVSDKTGFTLSTAGNTAVAQAARSEIDANSTKLDVTVGSRLAASNYTAPNNAGISTAATQATSAATAASSALTAANSAATSAGQASTKADSILAALADLDLLTPDAFVQTFALSEFGKRLIAAVGGYDGVLEAINGATVATMATADPNIVVRRVQRGNELSNTIVELT